MSLRLRFARAHGALPLLVLGWRLGLGPLLGRPLCLITASPDGEHLERAALPYVFVAGDIYIPAIGDPAWAQAAARRPQVSVQAHPGPLSTRAGLASEAELTGLATRLPAWGVELTKQPSTQWWVLRPTGDPGPSPALPDLNWVWVALGAGYAFARSIRRRVAAT